jgi:hypothetical protein
MTAHQAVHPIATMCRVLGVSPSGYYAWRQRPLSFRARADVKLRGEIQAIHRESRGIYGVPRVHAELAARGIQVGPKMYAALEKHRRLVRGGHVPSPGSGRGDLTDDAAPLDTASAVVFEVVFRLDPGVYM